jgi:hydrogenase-1 operon protein HyaF
MSLKDISVVDAPMDAGLAGETIGNVLAIVHEIEALLAVLVETGSTASIDLRALPMSPAERERLREFLGVGEVVANIEALGPTEVCETATPGIWWVHHRNVGGQTTAEFIEVTFLPEILRTDPVDARAGLARLRERLAQSGGGE